jgi:hypothetical protein
MKLTPSHNKPTEINKIGPKNCVSIAFISLLSNLNLFINVALNCLENTCFYELKNSIK